MTTEIKLGDIAVDVVLKDIKNVHLSVYPPTGRVRISAPLRMSLDTIRVFAISKLGWIKQQQMDTIRVFAISKLGWIKQQQTKLCGQERETPREYLDRESHYVWGRRHLLKVIECDEAPSVELRHSTMVLRLRPGTAETKRQSIVEEWYREQLKDAVPPLIAKWESIMGVKVDRFFVQRMKTKWGSCNAGTHRIRLNTDLAKKPRECLEYIVVHEMVHLLEPTHNARFVDLMDRLMPQWRFYRDRLNRLPVRHEEWAY